MTSPFDEIPEWARPRQRPEEDLPPGAVLESELPIVYKQDLPPGAKVEGPVNLVNEAQHPRIGIRDRLKAMGGRITSGAVAARALQEVGWETLPLGGDEFAVRLPGETEWFMPEPRSIGAAFRTKGIIGGALETVGDVAEFVPELLEGVGMTVGGALGATGGAIGGTAVAGPAGTAAGGVAGAVTGGGAGAGIARSALQGASALLFGTRPSLGEAAEASAMAVPEGMVGEAVGRYVAGPAIRKGGQLLKRALGGRGPKTLAELRAVKPPMWEGIEKTPEADISRAWTERAPPYAPGALERGGPLMGKEKFRPPPTEEARQVQDALDAARRERMKKPMSLSQGLLREGAEPPEEFTFRQISADQHLSRLDRAKTPEEVQAAINEAQSAFDAQTLPRAQYERILTFGEQRRKELGEMAASTLGLEDLRVKVASARTVEDVDKAIFELQKAKGALPPKTWQSLSYQAAKARMRARLNESVGPPEELAPEPPLAAQEAAGVPPEAPPVSPAAPEIPPHIQASLERSGRALPEVAPEPGGGMKAVQVPVSEINVDPETYQFKTLVNEAGIEKALEGKWDPGAAGNVVLHRKADGSLWVVNGHHRVELAKRKGVNWLNAQILDEAEGWSVENARKAGALWNIMDEKGRWDDYARFFRNARITADEARQQGLLAGAKAKTAWVLAEDAGDDLFAAAVGGKVEPEVAAAIARAAPKDTQLQYFGLKYALERKLTPHEAEGLIGLRKAKMPAQAEGEQQLDLFAQPGMEAEIAEELSTSKAARGIVTDLQRRRELAHRALRDKAAAQELGINVNDPDALAKLRADLDQQLSGWERWYTSKDLTEQARAKAGIKSPETPPGAPPQPSLPKATQEAPEGPSEAQKAAIERHMARTGQSQLDLGAKALPKPVRPEGDEVVVKQWPPERTTSPQELAELAVTREAQAQVKVESKLPKTGSQPEESTIRGRQEGIIPDVEPTPAQAAAIKRAKARAGKPPPIPPEAPPAAIPAPEEPLPPEARLAATQRAASKTREEFTSGHKGGIEQGETLRQALEVGRQHWGDKPTIKYRVDSPEEVKALLSKGGGEIVEILTVKNVKGGTPAEPRIMRATLTPPPDYKFKLPPGARDELKSRHNLVTVWEVGPDDNYLLNEAGEYVVRSYHADEILEAQVRGKVYQFFPGEGEIGPVKLAKVPAGRAKPAMETPPELSELQPPTPGARRPLTGQMTLEDLQARGPSEAPPFPLPKPRTAPPKAVLPLKERLKLGARGPVLEPLPVRRYTGPEALPAPTLPQRLEPEVPFEPRGKLTPRRAPWTAKEEGGMPLPRRRMAYEGENPALEKGARALQHIGRLLELPNELTDRAIDLLISGRRLGYGLRTTAARGVTPSVIRSTAKLMGTAAKPGAAVALGLPKAAGWSLRKLGEALERLAHHKATPPRLKHAIQEALKAVRARVLQPEVVLYLILQSPEYEDWRKGIASERQRVG